MLSSLKTKEHKEYSARRIKKILILRSSAITFKAVQLALKHDIDIVYLRSFGKPVGRIFASAPKGLTTLRKAQIEHSNSKTLFLATMFVSAKIRNQIEHIQLLQRKYKTNFYNQSHNVRRLSPPY